MSKRVLTAALVGNPNTGKSTFFNAWTGMHQVTGNWPGVTVEKLVGQVKLPGGEEMNVVDLPGIYSLHAISQDEQIASGYARSGDPDLIINVVDAVNLERNLYLTLALAELGKPMLVVLTMTDILKRQGFALNVAKLSKRLGVPIVSGDLQSRNAKTTLARAILEVMATQQHPACVVYPESLNQSLIRAHRENEPPVMAIHRLEGILSGGEAIISELEAVLGTTPDVLIADARYDKIAALTRGVVHQVGHARTEVGRTLDKIVLNRWLGIPIFLGIMYLLFWFTQVVGGCFIDFFDGIGDAVFVTGMGNVLTLMGTPEWLITLLANGLGSGIQTVLTFIPPVFFIFWGLSFLEDSGYMARAAYVMDRFMRLLGLPGSAFVPMLVGFGCTVPAIMATRTLSNKRDRLLTIFMAPFMSCGARLPVYALFGAAFFGVASGTMVFAIYMSGIVLAVLTGVLLKHTLFVGEPSPFVMELPLYHIPSMGAVLGQAWKRLYHFIFRAGKVMAIMVLLLSICDHIRVPDAFGMDEAQEEVPVIAFAGRAIAPVFKPMGVEAENWQGSVALIVGLFAKEQVVSALNTLYAIEDPASVGEQEEELVSLTWGETGKGILTGFGEAFQTIPEAFSGLFDTLVDPLGLEPFNYDYERVVETMEALKLEDPTVQDFDTLKKLAEERYAEELAASAEGDATLMQTLREKFHNDRNRAFAYLLFVLLYVPCLAAMATIVREIGWRYSALLFSYLTLLGWCVATLYFQITTGHQPLWLITPCALLGATAIFFYLLGKKIKVRLVV